MRQHGTLCATLVALFAAAACPAQAQAPPSVNIGLIAPFSGPWAEHGYLMRLGAEMAVEDINAKGGIAALGGAKINLVVGDTGATLETATNTAQRMFAPGTLSAYLCCWSSAFGLAVSELGERSKVPMLTNGYADDLVGRGYKYIFRDGAGAGSQVKMLLPLVTTQAKSIGREIKTAALVGDNTAATASYFKSLTEELPKFGIKIIVNRIWTPPLTDALPVGIAARDAKPDVVFLGATTLDDSIAIARALAVTNLKAIAIGNGSPFTTPEILKALGPQQVEHLLSTQVSAITKDPVAVDFLKRFKEKTKLNWTSHETTSAYAEMWIVKEALEKAKSADPTKVRDALSANDITTPPPTAFDGGDIKFDERGQNTSATVFVVQWQNGVPVLVSPGNFAVAPLKWPD